MAQVRGYERTEIAKPLRKHRALDRLFDLPAAERPWTDARGPKNISGQLHITQATRPHLWQRWIDFSEGDARNNRRRRNN
jgi:hypothetical protein